MSTRRWVLVALSFVLVFGISAWIVAASWPTEHGRLAIPLRVHLLLLALVAGEIGTRAIKLVLGARALGVPLRLGTAVRTVLGGDFGASVTPARSGAEPARFLVLVEGGVAPAGALIVMFLELALEMLSLAAVVVALAITFEGSGRVVGALVGLVGGYSAFVIGAGVFMVVLSWRNANGPPPAWARRLRINAGRWRRVQRALRQLRTSVSGLRDAHPGLMLGSLAASIAHVLFRLAVLPAIVLSLDPGVPPAKLWLWPLALFYGGVVAPAPGGGGFIEVAFHAALGGTIPAAHFVPALVWWRVYTFYLYIALGAVAAGRTALRALRPDASREHGARHEAVQAAHTPQAPHPPFVPPSTPPARDA